MYPLDFDLIDWSAYADGLISRQAWQDWAATEPLLPRNWPEVMPALTDVPPIMRRRIERLGRLACQVVSWCAPQGDGCPLVFASRHGDAERSLRLLADLIRGEPVSPTSFALSVHNAISALSSISRSDTSNVVAVAAGKATAVAGLIEAVALLADGHEEVLLVCYDAPLPVPYDGFDDESACAHAWAWRLAQAGRGGLPLRLQVPAEVVDVESAPSTAVLPRSLVLHRDMLLLAAGATTEALGASGLSLRRDEIEARHG